MTKQEVIEKALAGEATAKEYRYLLKTLEKVETLKCHTYRGVIWTPTILRDKDTNKTYLLFWGDDPSKWEDDFEGASFKEVVKKKVLVEKWWVVGENND